MAGRASVEFYVGLALKARGKGAGRNDGRTREEAFVVRTFRNGLAVFVSKSVFARKSDTLRLLIVLFRLGLEGLITFNKDTHEFDPENYLIKVPTTSGNSATIAVFDKITVDVSIEKDVNTQRGKVKVSYSPTTDCQIAIVKLIVADFILRW